jgi:hypothetical protein
MGSNGRDLEKLIRPFRKALLDYSSMKRIQSLIKAQLVILFAFGLVSLSTLAMAHAEDEVQGVKVGQPIPAIQGSGSTREDWKGEAPPVNGTYGVLLGIGMFDGSAGFALIPNVAGKLVDRGFVPDINNQVYLEGQAGPLFLSGGTACLFSSFEVGFS